MEWWLWVLIAVFVVGGLVALQRRRQLALRESFGPEYDRTVERAKSTREAERALRDRQKRHDKLELTALSRDARVSYTRGWNDIQAGFVDEPAETLVRADALLDEVMRARGYPVGEEFEEQADLVSVDHPDLVESYRSARRIRTGEAVEQASTEDLRQAFVHYRNLFGQLLADATDVSPQEEAPSDRVPSDRLERGTEADGVGHDRQLGDAERDSA